MEAWADPHDGKSSVTYPAGAFTQVRMPSIPPARQRWGTMVTMALTKAEQREALDLIQRLLDLLDDGDSLPRSSHLDCMAPILTSQ